MPTLRALAAFAHYHAALLVARAAAPVMRATGRRFTKASRDSWINCVVARVPANLYADRLPVGRVRFW